MDYYGGASNFASSVDESSPKTIYVGNLDSQMTEELLTALCGQYGPVKSCKVIKEKVAEPFAFIEFEERQAAQMAINAMTGRMCFGRKMKLNWALPNGSVKEKVDTSQHFHIFVGDLDGQTVEEDLIKAFSQFGMISDCRIVRDMNTAKSKCYGFLSFVLKENAELAIQQMNGYWLGCRSIRTNWATRKPNDFGLTHVPKHLRKPTYDEVSRRAGAENCTIFCGKIGSCISDNLLRKLFSPFGTIIEIRVFKDKGYGFVKFIEKSAAVRAIMEMNDSEVHGETMKVSWGKDLPGISDASQAQSTANYYNPSYLNSSINQYYTGYGIQTGMPYWSQPQCYQDQYSMLMQQQYYQSYTQNSQQQMPNYGYGYSTTSNASSTMIPSGNENVGSSQTRVGDVKSTVSNQNIDFQQQVGVYYQSPSAAPGANKNSASECLSR